MTDKKTYVAEPDPAFSTCSEEPPPWRVRALVDGELPWTIGQGMSQAEALACERALSGIPGSVPVDEVARRRVERTEVVLVGHEQRALGKVSGAPFVPYSAEDVAEVAKAARWLLEKKLAPSAAMAEAFARAVLTMAGADA